MRRVQLPPLLLCINNHYGANEMNYFSNMKTLVEKLGPSATMAEIDIVEDAVIDAIKLINDAYQEVIESRNLQAEADRYLETLSDYFKPQEESKDSQVDQDLKEKLSEKTEQQEEDKWQQEYNQKHINDGDWESGPVIVDVSE